MIGGGRLALQCRRPFSSLPFIFIFDFMVIFIFIRASFQLMIHISTAMHGGRPFLASSAHSNIFVQWPLCLLQSNGRRKHFYFSANLMEFNLSTLPHKYLCLIIEPVCFQPRSPICKICISQALNSSNFFPFLKKMISPPLQNNLKNLNISPVEKETSVCVWRGVMNRKLPGQSDHHFIMDPLDSQSITSCQSNTVSINWSQILIDSIIHRKLTSIGLLKWNFGALSGQTKGPLDSLMI